MSVKIPRCMTTVDWLQVSCMGLEVIHLSEGSKLLSKYPDRWGNHREYELSPHVEFVAGYEKQLCVRWKGQAVLHVGMIPRQKDVDMKRVNIKVANPVLYTSDWYYILNDFCMNLHLAVVSIVRIDLAIDLNYFVNGLYPETFLRKYLCNTKSYIRVGSNKWAAQGLKEQHRSNYDYIRWGSRQSGVCVYLYNKTRELQQSKDKPYIREEWQRAGLNTRRDVWRVEISLSSEGVGLKNVFTGLFQTLFIDDINEAYSVQNICFLYASKYFHFKRIVPNIRKKQDLPDLQLLPQPEDISLKPAHLYRKKETGRTEAAHRNYLITLAKEIESSDIATKYQDLDALRHVVSVLDNLYSQKRAARRHEKEMVERLQQAYRPDDFKRQLEAMHVNAIVRHNEEWLRERIRQLGEQISNS